ncbi:DUF4230 domain-containing protein [Segetibacter sp. 3557_3]|uniref:DUF4230 domain-containing protein n=1 Tax=Segetibacter sp. 3557_3 TaxID=2547429 RepID=UPI0010590584|nr:DUF4230 domain-containing protein [Segetibacter sp. 3557_3]TDH21241.1 DUF4230 domain-containing protein [Segetibacter sp. 3557_3]
MKLVLIACLMFFSSCTRKIPPEEKPSVLALREMGELATVEYTITKIIKASDDKTWYKLGDRKILMSCEAYLKAGVDLASLTESSYSVDGKNIHIRLPSPELISLNIPPDKIRVEYQQVGAFRDPFNSQERDGLAAQAEAEIRNSVNAIGILPQAKANTALFVSNFLRQAGFQNITISWSDTPGKTVAP